MSAAATPASAIRAYLERRRAALNEEIRRYPTPIARCDVQLGGLLDERDAATRLLRDADDASVLRGFAAGTAWWSDAEAQALRAAMADAA
jgi:hypothetical protein